MAIDVTMLSHVMFLAVLRYKYAPGFSTQNWVLQELIPGNVEFSVSLLVSHGNIVDMLGMRYTYVGPLAMM